MGRISLEKLERYLWGSANFLRGHIDAGDYKQFIFPLLFLKRLCDVYDEEYNDSLNTLGEDFDENHRFIIPKGHHWNDIRKKVNNIGTAIQTAMAEIEKANIGRLEGIFGDAQWTNKDRLPDSLLKDLIEHFSQQTLSLQNVSEDELGQAYEYLIKKFADDSGHTAQEFYSNRTIVRLMTELLEPNPKESVYDPTCGSGGMLLLSALHLKEKGKEYRSLRLFGQEINLITSSIAKMNMFLHGIEDFEILRGDTLENPAFIKNDKLRQFDIVLANPPYSIKRWNRERWETDPYGRNIYGTPPKSRADYAFLQHIIKSLKADTGRCAILFPHGVLFRDAEQEMRENLVKSDVIECILGLGSNLFYNSPMEACVIFCRTNKKEDRKGKILFINAINQVRRERTMSYIDPEHIEEIKGVYDEFKSINGFSNVVEVDEVLKNNANLNIPLYVIDNKQYKNFTINETVEEYQIDSSSIDDSFTELFKLVQEVSFK
ncbi:type I restriction-modification system subunit M [Evansella cellulosilytica]|uniref:site-specific DNA-methyltransferase (adenine-specific) n=1 Tax=Evansella cellulosilytica (strain ATCC 21833 / DSM 2522 / FERM P-1141 / JCM 9156 / N-4) TaxID=649639 RepID=E6TZV1_EVAC2|nr:class I SAM-dependent DNA methyltransferase [Evansella cellulosilytica]ADU32517.1 N-6 DNA methylase [Evansella cellulosilytica DSM 2522]